ncbi:hypothetical protein ACR80S_10955 [Halomonas sp. MA07-2]|uniref:hypothetical protein n=1 Tax=unclassified Halomonas TaxID=2609666 RepID=UPI003EEE9A98
MRYGLESVYSLIGAAPGSFLCHGDTLRRLVALLEAQYRVRLQTLGLNLEGLDERLAARNVPSRILEMPAVGLRSLNDRLGRWGLL